ncbi:nuclear transport factor 2 family protein [Kitasatospora sp. NPDC085879]|uniref:nuclear transport factor 2 family protein n=1 Tax=Kitasatospora sp. NPDC085879 TaxID=3154769 RepID=UPI003417DE55
MTKESLNDLDRLLAERACERLLNDFLHRLDLGEPSSVAELFTADGIWEWPAGERRIEGRDALRAYFGSRPADRLSRRMCSNIVVDVHSPTRATSISYFATYRVDGWSGQMLPPRLPANLGHYEDVFRQENGRWLLASRTLHLAFGGPTERLPPTGDPVDRD